ncbi:nickel pincer cofactor biosynthesis protein LarC [Desertifilum sp. FACHB-1129]|uniref:Putative nickel insertion protein n=1 Tax=Desertifilum tharense IPPAS B-1220 TaxID=1781255 RepID=A0A1E5QHD3_9CYAN|nr:nickel pincer cofactor biosynthesis protein LarC [Desertifilum tharense]MBD2315198.1 nickel pincer cofactor biosynthesis protein LarC [Desertifilum sp. FACHB-1129]MBD2320065.1 nickel pincer cofactor biosynthesis protein LarC [Desertifilum sp. FACHB-866]MBD2330193.1 nickel pincer cofactor biosynthesis protein LarC [Desertifilum sp. FACHB-868]MDA0211165.1 nickel pincer cofactor biosynthesis protein LarC [Cyanobacteria bacterium FC1]OEJ74096.1 TIGR00299 family protein [Desertifilum tharense IP
MKKVAYLDCPTGIAGDMCLGALVHAGVPLEYLIDNLNRLGIATEYQLVSEFVRHQGQQATKVQVRLSAESSVGHHHSPKEEHHSHHHSPKEERHSHHHSSEEEHHSHSATRHLPEIERMILRAELPQQVTDWSLAIFRKLAEAEGAVHGISPQKVHFHEVGATDAIVDIVGTCLGLDWLGIEALYCSPLPTGGGTVWAAHGRLPVPVPAVLKLWEMRQVPVYSNGIERELVTPTGAAIAITLATQFGPPPAMTLQSIGLGAGTRQLPIPNILRLWVGEMTQDADAVQRETVSVLETQIDDLSPQAIAYVFDLLLAAGALDVFTQPVMMKKSRLGVLLTVICWPEARSQCEAIMFRETTTLGIRHSLQQRVALRREIQSLQTPYGPIRVKLAWMGDRLSNVQPEYEDCARLAKTHQLPWRTLHQIALNCWYEQAQMPIASEKSKLS